MGGESLIGVGLAILIFTDYYYNYFLMNYSNLCS